MSNAVSDADADAAALADPAHWFARSAAVELVAAAVIGAAVLPEPYRQLLVHEGSMTERLERRFDDRVSIEHISDCANRHSYARWSLLIGQDGRCLAMGGVCLSLRDCSEALRTDILLGAEPLGRLLSQHGVEYQSIPNTYFTLDATPRLVGLLQMARSAVLFGRRTELLFGRVRCGQVIEVLPRYGAQIARRPV